LFTLGLGAGLAIVVPAPFLVHADWTTPSFTLLLAALFIVLPIAAGVFFIRVALVSAVDLRLDPATGQVTRKLRGPITRRVEHFPLSALAPPIVFMRDSIEEQAFPILRLRLPTGRTIDICCCRDLAEAELWRDRIMAMMATENRMRE
jgi:hypothetical protein